MNNKILIIIVVLLLGVGTFFFLASKPVTQSHRSYQIEVTSQLSSIEPKKSATFRYKIKNDKGEILKNYEIAHEKIMHFIVVRKDLQNFQHLHPDFNQATGEFTVDIAFPDGGSYRVFPDFTPAQDNPQKLPVTVYHDIDVGDISTYKAQSATPDTQQKKSFGEYQVTYSLPINLTKQQEITYTLTIERNGQPVTDLQQYLGAMGHSVILKEETLDFIHTHALGAKNNGTTQDHGAQPQQHGSIQTTTNKGPKIEFAATFPESGVYKIFTQFQHEGKIQTVDYTVKIN